MRASELSLPIVSFWRHVHGVEFEALSEPFRQAWAAATAKLPKHSHLRAGCLLRGLECLLQITGQSVPATYNAETFGAYERAFKQLLGALQSEHFYECSAQIRLENCRCLTRIRSSLAVNLGVPLTWQVKVLRINPANEQIKLRELFEAMHLHPAKVLIWQRWPCATKSNKLWFAPLTPIYNRLGWDFTVALYELTKTYVGGRYKSINFAVEALSRFCEDGANDATPENLLDPVYVTNFLSQLYEHWLHDKYRNGQGLPVSRIVNRWRGQITSFFKDYIFPSTLIAMPSGVFPRPRGISTVGEPTNIRGESGQERHEKLLTSIPLHITDDEAMELIFTQVKSDFDLVRNWAMLEVKEMAVRLARRRELASRGGVRKIEPGRKPVEHPTAWSHPNHLANGAATFEHYGFMCREEHGRVQQLFPAPATRWAHELAIPNTGALLPHCTLLVAEHPQITPSFLEGLELYDKNDKLRCIVPTDSGEIVQGAKLRRGADLASQDITLSADAAFALSQIVKLTEPLRQYLRDRNDGAWRYLLLTSKRCFGYPSRVSGLSHLTSGMQSTQRIAARAGHLLKLSPQEAEQFARRFSLSAVRASAAVLVYFNTKSVESMAQALGHAKYDYKLLDRYLPKVIRDFFQERWIRIFQTGIIVQALTDSPYLLRASGLTSISELDIFMRNHALKLPQQTELSIESEDPWTVGDLGAHKEVILGVNEEILTLLLSLQMLQRTTERPLAVKAQYWGELITALIPHIEMAAEHRPDIMQYLCVARANAAPALVESIAYEK